LKDQIQAIFGEIVKKYRLQQKLSQEKLAELANLDRTYISQIERGLKSPSITSLISLSKALKVKASWHDKLDKDILSQGVKEGYLTILVKSDDRKQYIFVQEPIPRFELNDLTWAWTEPKESKGKKTKVSKQEVLVEAATDEKHLGLQARSKSTGRIVLKWYIGQKQLFQCMTIPTNAPRFAISPRRIEMDSFINTTVHLLAQQRETSAVQPMLFQDNENFTELE